MIINKEAEERNTKRPKSVADQAPPPTVAHTPKKKKKNDKKIIVSLRQPSKAIQIDTNQKENKAHNKKKQDPTYVKLADKKAQAIDTIAEKNQLRHTKELLGLLFARPRKKSII